MTAMKILVIGSGGREHALVWKLAQSPHAKRLWCAPGNAGISGERLLNTGGLVDCVGLQADDLAGLLAFALENRPDLTVVGPDNPLALGVVDLFQSHGLRIWGPNKKAAQFESSKSFSQRFMERHEIPTAAGGSFSEPEAAKSFARRFNGHCAVKADGLALGKGVLLCKDVDEAEAAIDEILVNQAFGQAGRSIVIQEMLAGREISLHALCDGKTVKIFPTAQDHKRVGEGDQGPNTGGMGAYSPTPFVDSETLALIEREIFHHWLEGCAEEEIDFRGILYPGIMLTSKGPRVLEFNARFGDPETQTFLTRMQNDLVELLDGSVSGTLESQNLIWREQCSVCVVMASEGYPGHYERGRKIAGLAEASDFPDTKIFHAGTRAEGGAIQTDGGRVLGVTSWGNNLRDARDVALRAVAQIKFKGAHFRRDIAEQALRSWGGDRG
jgi:phosphoribosylamine--glycine ligase